MSIITESQFEVNQKHYPSFSFKELACQETGEIALPIDFLKELQKLHDAYGKPMIITSGYRSPKHSIESKKSSPGYHTQGAVDVAVSGEDAIQLLKTALKSRLDRNWYKHSIVYTLGPNLTQQYGSTKMLNLLIKPLLGVAGDVVTGIVETKKKKLKLN